MFEKTDLDLRAGVLARLALERVAPRRRKNLNGQSFEVRPHEAPRLGRRRRDAIEGFVVCVELGEATVVAEGGLFAFQTPGDGRKPGERVYFVREGDQFVIV